MFPMTQIQMIYPLSLIIPTPNVEEGLSMGEPYISMETISFSTLSYMSPTYPP